MLLMNLYIVWLSHFFYWSNSILWWFSCVFNWWYAGQELAKEKLHSLSFWCCCQMSRPLAIVLKLESKTNIKPQSSKLIPSCLSLSCNDNFEWHSYWQKRLRLSKINLKECQNMDAPCSPLISLCMPLFSIFFCVFLRL